MLYSRKSIHLQHTHPPTQVAIAVYKNTVRAGLPLLFPSLIPRCPRAGPPLHPSVLKPCVSLVSSSFPNTGPSSFGRSLPPCSLFVLLFPCGGAAPAGGKGRRGCTYAGKGEEAHAPLALPLVLGRFPAGDTYRQLVPSSPPQSVPAVLDRSPSARSGLSPLILVRASPFHFFLRG